MSEQDDVTLLSRYFSEVVSDQTVDLVRLVDQCLKKAAVPDDTRVLLKKHIVVSGGYAYTVAPVLRSRLDSSEYKVYGPSNPDAGQFDVVRGAENFLTLQRTKEATRGLFTSIDEYAASTEFRRHLAPTPAFYAGVSSPSQ